MPSVAALTLYSDPSLCDALRECGIDVIDVSSTVPAMEDYSAHNQNAFIFYRAHAYWRRCGVTHGSYIVVSSQTDASRVLNFVKQSQMYNDDLVCGKICMLCDAGLPAGSHEMTCRRSMRTGNAVYADLSLCRLTRRLVDAGLQRLRKDCAHPSIFWPSVVVLESYKMTDMI